MFKKTNLTMTSCLLIASFFALSAQADTLGEQRHENFNKVLVQNSQQDISTAQKIERLSATLIGAPYVDGNLGEGRVGKYDKDPLSRFDEFDCTTYVETVLAGAMSDSVDDFLPNLLKIRYKNGQVSFVTRNHFPSADWLPNNRWMLKDITAQVGADDTLFAETVIDRKSWYQHMTASRLQGVDPTVADNPNTLASLQQQGANFEPEKVKTAYIPLSAIFQKRVISNQTLDQQHSAMVALMKDNQLSNEQKRKAKHELAIKQRLANSTINTALLQRIPEGSLISMVRPDYKIKQWIGTNMNITHQAFVIRKQGHLYIRNASLIKKEVVDQDFLQYFSRYLDGSSLKGFNVQQPSF